MTVNWLKSMKGRPEWMTGFHILILNIFYESGMLSTLSVSTFNDNLPFDRAHISRELSRLEGHGFLTRVGEGKYRLSEMGRDFLLGEIAPGELDESELGADEDG